MRICHWNVLSLVFACCVSPLFGQDWGSFDPSPVIPPTAGGVAIPYPFFTQSLPIEEEPDHSPDDPELARLLKSRQADYTAAKQFAEEGLKQYERIQEQTRAVKSHIFESRKREITSYKPQAEPDGTTTGLDLFTFPELDGSTSCANLGAIVTARVLRIPYAWQMHDSQGSQPYNTVRFRRTSPHSPSSYGSYVANIPGSLQLRFEVVADAEKTTFRQRNIFRDYFGQFQGTHPSYMSLIGPAKENAPASVPGVLMPTPGNMPPTSAGHVYSSPSSMSPMTGSNENFPASEIILVARKPSQDELTAAKQAGVELDVRPIARDAFIFLVSRKNPVESLTLEEIQSIFATPQQRNWNEFGGNDAPITPFERERNSGSREIMDKLVVTPEIIEKYNPPQQQTKTAPNSSYPSASSPPPSSTSSRPQSYGTYGGPPRVPFRDQRRDSRGFVGMGAPFVAVQQNHDTIAYSVYHYEHFMNCVLDTRVLAVNGVMPNHETIRSDGYPLCCDVYVVTRKGIADDSPAARLRDWLLSEDGQNCIAESGYVPIRSVEAKTKPRKN